MKKHFKTVGTTLIVILVLSSVITVFTNSASAKLFGADINIQMTYSATDANQDIAPLSTGIQVRINLSASIVGTFAKLLETFLSGRSLISIDLSVQNTPAWVTATVTPNIVTVPISTTPQTKEAIVLVSFNEDAPAHEKIEIIIQMQASASFGRIRDKTTTASILLTPAYLPIIDVTPQSTYQEIGPGQIAVFDLNLENLGNAQTEFLFSVEDVPKEWSASIVSNTKVGSAVDGEKSTKTIQLFIQPPYGFGYHNDRQDIKISVIGRYFASTGEELKTPTYEYIFTVQSRGFSTPGFELPLMLIAIIGIAFVIKKKQKKR